MKLNKIIILLYLFLTNQNLVNNGVYNILFKNSYIYYYKGKILLSNEFKYPNTFIRIRKISGNFNETLFSIQEIDKRYILSYLDSQEIIFNKKKNTIKLWNFIKINENNYIIKNSNNCYIVFKKEKFICDNIPIEQASQFNIIKIFKEVGDINNIFIRQLIENEPIDILIKYIDLKDQNLKRNGIHQIEKDYDNEELRYAIRSILMNIPWIRKIFILMPNEKVRFFKEYKLIKDKIIYVNDKDFLGYDSSNCNAFLFRYWKMKKFGISDNVIVMDDDCFIGSKLEKSDFFYVKNGKVVPSIITSHFIKLDKKIIESNCDIYRKKAQNSKEEQNDDIFNYSKFLTFNFVLNFFNKTYEDNIYLPKFTHNAIPVNLNDVKEIYDLVYHSKYRNTTLESLFRHYEYLQFQIFLVSYTFIKYNKKIKDISYKFIKINNTLSSNFKASLFCINKGPGNYSSLKLLEAKMVMEYLFPTPSPYEIIDYSAINLSYNIAYIMDEKLRIYENEIKNSKNIISIISIKYNILIIILFLVIKINIACKND